MDSRTLLRTPSYYIESKKYRAVHHGVRMPFGGGADVISLYLIMRLFYDVIENKKNGERHSVTGEQDGKRQLWYE